MRAKKIKFTCTSCDAKTAITSNYADIIIVFRNNKPISQTTYTCEKCTQKFATHIPVKLLEIKLDYEVQ